MGGFADFGRETEEINRQTVGIRRLRTEMEAERQAWERQEAEQRTRDALQADRDEWARDAKTVAEYEQWELQTLLAQGDAEEIAVR